MIRIALALALGLAAPPLLAETPPESLRAAAWIEAIPAEARITLYALTPEKVDFPNGKDDFHGFPVLGRAEIGSAKERAALLGNLAAAARACQSNETKCFNPRHGLRVETPSGTSDFVICFQCHLVSVYGAEPLNLFMIAGPSDVFDRALKAHGLPRAK